MTSVATPHHDDAFAVDWAIAYSEAQPRQHERGVSPGHAISLETARRPGRDDAAESSDAPFPLI